MVPDHVLFDSLEKTATNRKKLIETIEQFICVSALRLHMTVPEIRALTDYSRARLLRIIERADPSASTPSRDPVAGRARVERELPELVRLHDDADALVHKLARICVIQRKMSANELARRTGHSRDFTQKWVKQIRKEGLHTEIAPTTGWYTPQWGEEPPVDPKYIITLEEAQRRREDEKMSVVPTMIGGATEDFRGYEARRTA
jgi:biotin operon repressor